MSLWMLLVFGACMLSAILTFKLPGIAPTTMFVFLCSALVFVMGLAWRGIRRPVV